ncbi:dihydroxyacetone kinase subunit DhaL [Streptomyces hainanensis]|uniref:Dihydroxyacetone kinase subunit L n=1 Tax=Streptomyces hainanensis TaxID=402648 RepID=A0A4R4SIT6_9ACTN|nr:dihydroxyacetone kinase subunit DhaL [Streptomyces hainanensis]TDC63451.1 dihydroxyacetone kinase subunit L [Streptomyces hainanensis]
MDTDLALSWVRSFAAAVAEHEERLTQLDSAIGDADHGANLRRGFSAVLAVLDERPPTSAPELLTVTGDTLVPGVGGAAGPLYGSAFRALGRALARPETGLATALAEALDAVRTLGAAAVGDKTMIDAFAPAVEAFARRSDAGDDLAAAASAAAEAAERGALATTPLQARRGRAAYLGPRSVGHQDPGAASTALLFRALADAATGTEVAR